MFQEFKYLCLFLRLGVLGTHTAQQYHRSLLNPFHRVCVCRFYLNASWKSFHFFFRLLPRCGYAVVVVVYIFSSSPTLALSSNYTRMYDVPLFIAPYILCDANTEHTRYSYFTVYFPFHIHTFVRSFIFRMTFFIAIFFVLSLSLSLASSVHTRLYLFASEVCKIWCNRIIDEVILFFRLNFCRCCRCCCCCCVSIVCAFPTRGVGGGGGSKKNACFGLCTSVKIHFYAKTYLYTIKMCSVVLLRPLFSTFECAPL